MDNFVSIPDFPDYFINRKGDVLSKKWNKEIILEPAISNGYLMVCFRKDKKSYNKRVHRLIAEIFIPNPNNYLCVDHINRDRKDNRLENLRWVTHAMNSQNQSITNISGYRNICYCKNKWIVLIKRNKKVVCDRKFKTIEEAVSYRNKVLIELNEEAEEE